MQRPSDAELAAIADDLSLALSGDEVGDYARLVGDVVDAIADVERQPNASYPSGTEPTAERRSGYRPDDWEDPYNAWITKCEIEGDDGGPLEGLAVGLKDNVSVAGIELTNGSTLMDGYVPPIDATVVRRLLDAGATVVGKTNMWSFSSGPSDYGTVTNPAAEGRTVGGSSSGTAAAVAAGEVDVGIGCDQGGSIRIPASFSGIVGLKPTYGLVPYTGIFGSDATIDHVGPMTRSVEHAALALDVLAGRDGLDPRQPRDLVVDSYSDGLRVDGEGLTVGLLEEGFEIEGRDEAVSEAVREATADLAAAGVEVTEVSVPDHHGAKDLPKVLSYYGAGQELAQSGIRTNVPGWHDVDGLERLGQVLATRRDELPHTIKLKLLVSEYVRRTGHGTVYARAHNRLIEFRERYDAALDGVDALVMPTCPVQVPEDDLKRMEAMLEDDRINPITANARPFNGTSHPALTVPCGSVDGAPVGVMFVGRRFDEATLLQLGSLYERVGRA
jgi:amidase